MNSNTIQLLSDKQPVAVFREDPSLFYRKQLKKAEQPGSTSKLFRAPQHPDQETIERLNRLAAKAPFCSYHKWKKNNHLL